MMLTVLPDWVRAVATCLIWAIFLLQLWSLYWTWRQRKQWQEGERARMARWTRDMEAAAKLYEEASHLRAQAEVALAQARRQQVLNDKQGS